MQAYLIGPQEVNEGQTELIETTVNGCLERLKLGQQLTPVIFGMGGYDADSRALFDITEVRFWCRQLYRKIPFIFSVLHSSAIQWFFPCIAEIEIISRTAQNTAHRYTPAAVNLVTEIVENNQKLFESLISSQDELEKVVNENSKRILQSIMSIIHNA